MMTNKAFGLISYSLVRLLQKTITNWGNKNNNFSNHISQKTAICIIILMRQYQEILFKGFVGIHHILFNFF